MLSIERWAKTPDAARINATKEKYFCMSII